MKTGRSIILVATSAAVLVSGWATGSGFLSPTGATNLSANGSSAPSSSGSGTGASGSSTASSTPAAGVTGTFDGDSVRTRYGNYQAEITVAAGKITDISMLQSGASDGTSRQISGYALPQLIKAVLQQQTANVGYVSGASFTTQGFESSVQSAMQAAGLA